MSDKPPTPAAEPTPAAGSSAQNPNGGKGEAETLASEEVIELQAFLERREWIEEKIRLLEKMPPIDVFGGIQEMLASSSTPITCLPSREELAEWVAEHDKIEHEAEQFDAGDMNRLKKFTKAATQRNLSREDTDLIEVTLTTLLALDRLLHLLRGRSENLELMSIRLTWEEQRLLAWNERQSVLADLRAFIANRAQWNPACYENPPSAPTIDRRLSSASNASGPPGDLSSSTSTSRSALSRGSRYMLAEVLSLDAAQFSTRLVGLSKSVAASGKTLDKLIDSSHRKPVPDELLDEQDKIENESSATEGLGKFAMAMVMQWKKSDEIYGELKKDQAAAVALREEIESAKLQHPNQKFNESFTARSAALTARLAVVGDPATSRSFPRPYHALFPNQNAANTNLTKILSRELAISAKAIREAATSAAQYQGMMENITEIERLRDTMVSLTTRLEVVTQHYTTGIPSQDGDGSIPNLEDASCLNPTRHGAFLALLPATHKEHGAVNDEAKQTKAQCTAILSKVGAAGIDPNLKSGVQTAAQRLENQQQVAEAARKNVQARIETMREARNIKASASSIQETTTQLRRQIVRALQHQRWKPQRVQDGRPLTPESPLSMGTTAQPLLTPSDAFLQADALTTQTASTVEKPLAALSESLGSSLSSALEDTQRSITHRIREVKRLTSLWESVKRQTAAMDSVRREAHNIEADLADLVYQYDTVLDLTTEESTPASLASRDAELKTLLDTTNDKAQQFINTLSTRVPFIANSAHSEAFTLASSSDDPDAPGRLPFALISLDDSVRADANAYAVSISGSLATLSKKSGYLAIARLAHEFEDHKRPVVNELDETSRLVASVQASMNKLEANGEHESSMLDTLTGFEGQVEAFLKDFTPRIGSKLASVRHVFAKMTAAPGAGDSFVQERFLNSRSREVEKLAAMVDSATRDLSALANRIGSAKLLEMRRIEAEQAKLLADQRAKEEAEERARLEAEIARFEEEERKRKELEELRRIEMEQARIEAEEAAKRAEEERKRAQEAEQARLKAEREAEMLEQQRLREEELARVDAEKRRLEAEAEAHREAEAAARRELEEGRRREQEMASKIAAEREAQEVEKRRRRDTETERLAEEARLRAEVARQEAEILRLAEEIRRDRDARSSADVPQVDEFGVVSTGSPSASALVVVSPEGAMEGSEVFGSHSGDGRHMSEDMIQLKNKIDSIRKELRDIGINALARPSLNAPFPAKAEVDKMRVRFLRLQKERSKLPGSSPDALLNAELTSLKFEVDNSVILMAHLTRLVEFVKRLGVCDGALSELLNHVDSFPALPAGEDLVYHYSDPKETPKAQLGARLTFTEAAVDKVKTCAEGLAADNRVTEESKRIQQTWDELRDMANDCLIEMPSRPSTSTSISSMSTTSVRRRTMVPSASAPSPLDLSTRRGPSTPRANMGTQSRTPSQSSSLRRSSSRISTRSVSGPTFSTPKAPAPKPAANTGGFKIRERTTSTSSSSNPTGIFATSSRLLASTFSSRQHANRSNISVSTPQLRPESRFSSHSRGPSPLPSYQTPSRGGTWSKARRPSLGATLPRNFKTAAETTPKPRRTYVPNPTNKLDVAVGAVVNQLPVEINIEASEDNWKDQSGKYWIGDEDPKLCYCRILRSSTVMVRVGGGWVELSKFIKDHFADLFRLLPITATPPHAPQNEPRWISSATLQEENENTPTRPKYRGASKPGTPEPRRAPSRASVSPSFFTPPGISPNGPTSSANSSPLTPIQFMRRVDESGPRARPTSPLSRTVRGRGQPLGRPAAWR